MRYIIHLALKRHTQQRAVLQHLLHVAASEVDHQSVVHILVKADERRAPARNGRRTRRVSWRRPRRRNRRRQQTERRRTDDAAQRVDRTDAGVVHRHLLLLSYVDRHELLLLLLL